MSFTFYGSLDQYWLDEKTREFNICPYEVQDRLIDYGFSLEQILETPNPIISAILDILITNLIEEIEEITFMINQDLLDKIREKLQETTFVNSLDSHISSLDVFEELQNEIKKELTNIENLPLGEGFEEPTINELEEVMKQIQGVFERYDF